MTNNEWKDSEARHKWEKILTSNIHYREGINYINSSSRGFAMNKPIPPFRTVITEKPSAVRS